MSESCRSFEGILSLYETGELDEPTRDELVVHLERCESCREVLEGYRALSQLCEEAKVPTLSEEVSSRVLSRLREELPLGGPSRTPVEAPEIMTMEDAARFLQVALEDLESELGDLPCFEFAGKLRIRKVALTQWIEQRERTSRRRRLLSVVEG